MLTKETKVDYCDLGSPNPHGLTIYQLWFGQNVAAILSRTDYISLPNLIDEAAHITDLMVAKINKK